MSAIGLILSGSPIGRTAPPPPILDSYPGSLCWAFRRMSSAQSGPLATIRRDTDNATLDIGLAPDGVEIDKQAIEAFCSGANCYVQRIYEQGGGPDFEMPTQTAQPKIFDLTEGLVLSGPSVGMFSFESYIEVAGVAQSFEDTVLLITEYTENKPFFADFLLGNNAFGSASILLLNRQMSFIWPPSNQLISSVAIAQGERSLQRYDLRPSSVSFQKNLELPVSLPHSEPSLGAWRYISNPISVISFPGIVSEIVILRDQAQDPTALQSEMLSYHSIL